ncbi:hypothetical protein KP509_34G000900 [Ceratopteris richardii]|uniref:Uncharacterized protein n=1 Tax=Ceratopteris richardii TaxID=49495 RepID=A0A8T2QI37_CERRI|nr:hypothetical protein KP509_34G000900 [Ceratopteris richardii]
MEFNPPIHHVDASLTNDNDELWRPGASAHIPASFDSPGGEQTERTHMDRQRCKQELQKLYEDTSESCYDLSLKDIVDPCYSISGNLKGVVAEEELRPHVQERSESRKLSSIPKLRFSFSLSGSRGKSMLGEQPDSSIWKTTPKHDDDEKPSAASKDSLIKASSSSKYTQNAFESNASSMSKIHPSNQCSSCSSFTVFFKCRCLICGRLYCSMCAKEYMENLSTGFKCKAPCKYRPLRKRLSQKIANRCWPIGMLPSHED